MRKGSRVEWGLFAPFHRNRDGGRLAIKAAGIPGRERDIESRNTNHQRPLLPQNRNPDMSQPFSVSRQSLISKHQRLKRLTIIPSKWILLLLTLLWARGPKLKSSKASSRGAWTSPWVRERTRRWTRKQGIYQDHCHEVDPRRPKLYYATAKGQVETDVARRHGPGYHCPPRGPRPASRSRPPPAASLPDRQRICSLVWTGGTFATTPVGVRGMPFTRRTTSPSDKTTRRPGGGTSSPRWPAWSRPRFTST